MYTLRITRTCTACVSVLCLLGGLNPAPLFANTPPPPLPTDSAELVPLDLSQPIELPMAVPEYANPTTTPLSELEEISPEDQAEFEEFMMRFGGATGTAPDLEREPLTEEEIEAVRFYNPLDPGEYEDALPPPITPEESVTASLPPEAAVCFDYYTFGSVQTSVTSDLGSVIAGTTISPQVTVLNENDYPIVDGTVYIKVFKKSAEQVANAQGHDIVDQFFLPDTITLAAGEGKALSFDWSIPAYLTSGEYQFVTYFSSAKRFNLMGLPFTDDVFGGVFDFTIMSDQAETVYFDKNQVTVAGEPHFFTTYIPTVGAATTTIVTATLVNDTDQVQAIPVTYSLYGWDQQHPQNLQSEETETITLEPNEARVITRSIDPLDGEFAVTLLTLTAAYNDAKSVMNVRFSRDNVPAVRLNFPGVTTYPLLAGETTTLFSCVHSASNLDTIPGGKLILTLSDVAGTPLHTYQYEGTITGQMMAVKDEFTPATDLKNFTLTADLYRNDTLVESASMNYSCTDILGAEADCTEPVAPTGPTDTRPNQTLLLVGLGVLLALSVAGFYLYRRRLKPHFPKPPVAFFVFLLGLSVWGGVQVPTAAAVSVTAVSHYPGMMHYQNTYFNSSRPNEHLTYWWKGLSHPTASVSYYANVRDGSGNVLHPGATVSVGSMIYIKDVGRGGISYTGTGYNEDTPPGYWVWDAGWPTVSPGTEYMGAGQTSRMGTCSHGYVGSVIYDKYAPYIRWYDTWIPLSVHPAPAYLSGSAGTTAGLSCNAAGWCEVTSPGTINLQYTFAATYARYYYEYSSFGRCQRPWTQTPMNNTHINIPQQNINYTLTAYQPNANPNTPTISGAPNGAINTPVSFTLTGTDPDGDRVRYGIDWDMNGTVDQWVPGGGHVNSGTAQSVSRTWTTVGAKTFQVITQDEYTANSGWTTHSVNIYQNGACGTRDGKLYPSTVTSWPGGDTLCAAGSASPANPPFPHPGSSRSWQCIGVGAGSTNASCSATRATPPNLFLNGSVPPTAGSIDPISGLYSGISFSYNVANAGLTNAGGFQNALRINGNAPVIDNISAGLAAGATVSRSVSFPDSIMFGTHVVSWSIDDTDAVAESNEFDNVGSFSFTFTPADPGIELIVPEAVRRGEAPEVRWDLKATYPLECVLRGAGLPSYTISSNGTTNRTGTVTPPPEPITSTSVYQLRCTEPITGTVFTTERTVDVIPLVEEI